MGFKALITIDLPSVTEENRKVFYKSLEEDKWVKVTRLTTTWRATFQSTVTRDGAIQALIADLRSAKVKSGIRKVEYALQLDESEIQEGTL